MKDQDLTATPAAGAKTELEAALTAMLKDYLDNVGMTRQHAVSLFLAKYPRASLDSQPVPPPHTEDFPTVRDGYAMAALQGFCVHGGTKSVVVREAFEVADACMIERAKASSTPEGSAK